MKYSVYLGMGLVYEKKRVENGMSCRFFFTLTAGVRLEGGYSHLLFAIDGISPRKPYTDCNSAVARCYQ